MICNDVDPLKCSVYDVAMCSISHGSPAATTVNCDPPIDEYSVPDLKNYLTQFHGSSSWELHCCETFGTLMCYD